MAFALARKVRQLFLGTALLGLGITSAHAEGLGIFNLRQPPCPAPCPTPSPTAPVTPAKELPPPTTAPTPAPAPEPSLQPVTTAALGDTAISIRSDAGYIDNALPFTHFRTRYDSAFNDNRPDRAEFFYPKCGCFPDGRGPVLPEKKVDYQDISAYVEVASRDNLYSFFIEGAYRFLNPDVNDNTSGFGDMNLGFKAAFWRTNDSILTFQFRAYIPTGDGRQGLGTEHVSLEPSLLFAHNFNEKLLIFGQVGDWIPVGGTDFAGNVLRYGIGSSYLVVNTCNFRAAPVAEVLAWTVLSGGEADFDLRNPAVSASGDTIVNGKIGVRFGFGPTENIIGMLGRSDFYIGYGRALTGEVWYKDILRLEYRMQF